MSVGFIIFEVFGSIIGFGCLLFCLFYNVYYQKKNAIECEKRKHKSIENDEKMK